ncbi:MAG: glycosyltransferase family 2 protein [Eubacteriales bacterium]
MCIKTSEIAIIILNYNTPYLTIKNVDIIIENNKDVIIAIVDNNSMDSSYSILSKYYTETKNVHVIQSPKNGGYSYGNNFGCRYILELYEDIKFIAIMNPDVQCREVGLLYKLAHELQEDKLLAVLAPVMIQDELLVTYKIGWKCDSLSSCILKKSIVASKFLKKRNAYDKYEMNHRHNIIYCDVVQGSLFMIKRDVFESVGFFDEKVFLYYEEAILAHKLKKLGYREGTLLTNTYIHEHTLERQTLKKRRKTIRQDFQSEMYYCKEYLKIGIVSRGILKVLNLYYICVEMLVAEYLYIAKKWYKIKRM